MTDEIERLLVRVEANAAQFEGQMKRINKALYGSAAEVRKTRATFKREMDQMGRDIYQPVQAASALALAAVVGFSYQAAKRAEAVRGAFNTTFEAMPEKANAATKAIADDFKRLETDIKDNFTQLQSVMTALGVDAETALTIVDQLQRRSLDIAAFKDISDAQAFQAVISGITGETEPLKRLGIVVNEAATKAELMRLGFKGNAEQASEAAKAIARTNIILARSGQMQGQVAREADNLANKEKEATTQFQEAAEQFGQQFLPVAADVLSWAADALEGFNNLPSGVQNASLAFLALVAVGGPIAKVITGFRALIAAATAARAAIALAAGTGAASAAGGAAVGAGAVAGATAGAVGVASIGLASFAPAPPPQSAPVEERLAYARQHQRTATGYIRRLEAEKRAKDELRRGVLALATPPDAPSPVLPGGGAGDFGLSEAQRTGTGFPTGRGGRGGRGGVSDAEAMASRREALAIELAIARARATGDEASIRAAEEREQLARLVQQYTDAGSENAQGEAMEHLALLNQGVALAEEREKVEAQIDLILAGRDKQIAREAEYQQQINDQLMEQLSFEAELARLRGEEGAIRDAERREWIEARINDLLSSRRGLMRSEAEGIANREYDMMDGAEAEGRFRDLVVQAGTDFGSLAEDAGARFKRRALEGLADALWKLVGNLNIGGKSGTDWAATAMQWFGGKFATGGLVTGPGGGTADRVPILASAGEFVVNAKASSQNRSLLEAINGGFPLLRSVAGGVAAGSRAPPVQQFTFDNRGAVIWEGEMARMRAYASQQALAAAAGAVRQAEAAIPAQIARDRRYTRG